MNRADIEKTVRASVGDPTSGIVADVIPAIVDALDVALNPKPTATGKPDTRIVSASETR